MAKKQPVTVEKIFNIPLRKKWVPVRRVARTKRAVSTVRDYVTRHTRSSDIKISTMLNSVLWSGGAKHPPGKIKVKVLIDEEGKALVRMPEEITFEEEKKKILARGKEKGKGKKPEAAKDERVDAKEEKPETGEPSGKEDEGKESTEPEKPAEAGSTGSGPENKDKDD